MDKIGNFIKENKIVVTAGLILTGALGASYYINQQQKNKKTLFERVGGHEAMSAAVEKFYVKVLADPVVNDFFKSTDMAKQKRQQQTFLTHVLGGPNNYNGKDMRTAHEHLGIREEHFNAIATHLQNTLLELGVDKGLVNEIIAVVATTKKDILNQ